MIEEWRDIPGFPGYQASTEGRIRSLDRISVQGHKLIGRLLRTGVRRHIGYLYVIPCVDARRITMNVHALVALAFIGPRPKGMHVAHDDCNHLNNRPSNLFHKTVSANRADSILKGRHRLSVVALDRVRSALAKGDTNVSIAARENISPQMISHIKNKRSYRAPLA